MRTVCGDSRRVSSDLPVAASVRNEVGHLPLARRERPAVAGTSATPDWPGNDVVVAQDPFDPVRIAPRAEGCQVLRDLRELRQGVLKLACGQQASRAAFPREQGTVGSRQERPGARGSLEHGRGA